MKHESLLQAVRHKSRTYDMTRERNGNFDEDYTVYNDPIESYEDDFRPIQAIPIAELLTHVSAPVVLDLMAPSGTLADLFTQLHQTEKYGLAVSLDDLRETKQIERDDLLGISQINANLLLGSTWRKIEAWLGDKKANVIMERARFGLGEIPFMSSLFALLAQRMYNLLDSNEGVLLLQMFDSKRMMSIGIDMDKWVNLLEDSGVGAKFANGGACGGVLKLVRYPHSPKLLPLE